MKDFSCASPASTAICSSMDKRAIVHHRTRPISRSHLSSPDHKKNLSTTPCISQLPFDPKTFSNFQKSRKSSAKNSEMQRKSSAKADDVASPDPGLPKFLLSDNPVFETLAYSDNAKALVPNVKARAQLMSSSQPFDKSLFLKSLPSRSLSSQISSSLSSQISSSSSLSLKSSSTHSLSRHQVVELMVSIHCKGCEGKVRKHISKMEGVTSFSIDMESKKVTIVGDVTPQAVLTSVSRVKYAQFWPSPNSSSSSPSTPNFELIAK